MTIQELQNSLQGYHYGAFKKATWKSTKIINGVCYEKTSKGVVRFVDYENMASTKLKRANGSVKKSGNGNNYLIKNVLYQANNGSWLVSMKTTSKKAICEYKINGVVVDKATYELAVPSVKNDSGMFTVKLENLISLG
ncbi:MAG: hypothetical protein K5765_06925 [Clostridia bacterium]|nr:hypothetical protein [Clostridia bacterium]